MTSSSNPPPAQQRPTKRTVVVVVPSSRRKLTIKSKHHPRQQQQQRLRCLTTPLPGAGLPSFSRAKSTTASALRATSTYDDDDDDDATPDEVDALLAELPSDTHLAIQSLQQESRGLQIPLSPSVSSNGSTGSYSIQVLLEYQILERFSEHHRSVSDTVSELHHLLRTNQLQQLVCVGDSHTLTSSSSSTTNRHDRHRRRRRVAYLWTRDYIAAVRQAQHQQQQQQQNQSATAATATSNMTTADVTEWFIQHLSCWSGLTTISKLDFDEKWPPIATTAPIPWTVNKAIQQLLSIQVLRRDDSNGAVVVRGDDNDDERYQLWLPQWGLVCKAWNHATQRLLLALAKAPRKELSERNLLAKHHHDRHDGIIPMAFLLDDLQHEGIIQILERPFGRFVKANPPSQIRPVAATTTK